MKKTLLVLLLPHLTLAWFVLECTKPLVQERLDPIASPGISPSNHVHTVHGANNFALNSTYDTLRASTCTSCLIAQDLSNYWFPKLYFRDPKTGKFEDVRNGGLLVYYQNRGTADAANGGTGLKAFPPGLKMMAGSPVRRSRQYAVGSGSQHELAERAIAWSCYRYTSTTNYDSTQSGTFGFPNSTCEAGLNARIHMPACWDGVNLDSPDHTSHTAYLSELDNGDCPATHPVPLMKMLYEVQWDVQLLTSRWDPATDAWPFVYSNGDTTGYSWHADFQNGWDVDALQNAIDNCNNPDDATGRGDATACKHLTVLPPPTGNKCKIDPTNKERTSGLMDKLPGCNPLQMGPGDASMFSDVNCPQYAADGTLADAALTGSSAAPTPSGRNSAGDKSGSSGSKVDPATLVFTAFAVIYALTSAL